MPQSVRAGLDSQDAFEASSHDMAGIERVAVREGRAVNESRTFAEAHNFINRDWHAVVAVAHALEASGVLAGEQTERIIAREIGEVRASILRLAT